MRIYSTLDPYDVDVKVRTYLNTRGVSADLIPFSDFRNVTHKRGRLIPGGSNINPATGEQRNLGGLRRGYFAFNMALYTDSDFHAVTSPYRPQQSRNLRVMECRSATWDQWGLYLGAMLDCALEDVIAARSSDPDVSDIELSDVLRITGAFDHRGKNAIKDRNGLAYRDSREAFIAVTGLQFLGGRAITARDLLSGRRCRAHKWTFNGAVNSLDCTREGCTAYQYRGWV